MLRSAPPPIGFVVAPQCLSSFRFYLRKNHGVRCFEQETIERLGERETDKDRIEGPAKQIKGKIKEVSGKTLGDAKLESEGKAEQVAGKAHNMAGGLKDAVKGE